MTKRAQSTSRLQSGKINKFKVSKSQLKINKVKARLLRSQQQCQCPMVCLCLKVCLCQKECPCLKVCQCLKVCLCQWTLVSLSHLWANNNYMDSQDNLACHSLLIRLVWVCRCQIRTQCLCKLCLSFQTRCQCLRIKNLKKSHSLITGVMWWTWQKNMDRKSLRRKNWINSRKSNMGRKKIIMIKKTTQATNHNCQQDLTKICWQVCSNSLQWILKGFKICLVRTTQMQLQ